MTVMKPTSKERIVKTKTLPQLESRPVEMKQSEVGVKIKIFTKDRFYQS